LPNALECNSRPSNPSFAALVISSIELVRNPNFTVLSPLYPFTAPAVSP
jgi:hypothetical protein